MFASTESDFCSVCHTWLKFSPRFLFLSLATNQTKKSSKIQEADYLTAAAFTFQLWDLFVTFIIPEQNTAVMVCHHTLASLVAWYGLNNQVRTARESHLPVFQHPYVIFSKFRSIVPFFSALIENSTFTTMRVRCI